MSLLMEALRWAEEAKSKVEAEAAEGALLTSAEGLPASAESTRTSTNSIPDPAAVITGQTLALDSQNKTESGKTYPDINPLTPEENALLKNKEPSAESGKEPLANAGIKPSIAQQTNIGPAPSTEQPSREFQDHKPSINALFQAKRATQQQRMRKIRSIAALLLLLPVGGGIYWYYMSSFDNQILLPPSTNLSDADLYQEPTEQVNLSSAGSNEMPPSSINENTTILTMETPLVEESALNRVDTTQSEENTVLNQEESALSEKNIVSIEENPTLNEVNQTLGDADSSLTIKNTAVEQSDETSILATSSTTRGLQTSNPTTTSPPVDAPVIQSESSPAISFIRTLGESELNSQLSIAYASYQNGNYEMALRQYQEILNLRENDRNAMLGLASVYAKQSRTALAQNMYSRLLTLNPKDPLARAGLIDLTKTIDPVYRESELKALLELHPDVAPLAFALGNLYASQSRWSEAQNAYFDASLSAKSSSAGPISPDYPFNLAVSLERLNQLRPAYNYYREALELSRYSVPGFDPALLNSRLEYLERTLQ